jgi:hypothetical protein
MIELSYVREKDTNKKTTGKTLDNSSQSSKKKHSFCEDRCFVTYGQMRNFIG